MSEPRKGCMIEYLDRNGTLCSGYIQALSKNKRADGRDCARFYWVVAFPWELMGTESQAFDRMPLTRCVTGGRVKWISEESVLE